MSGTTSGVEFSQSGDDLNIRIFRGKTMHFELIWGGANPIDVSGYQARLQARDLNGMAMLDLSDSNGGIVIGGTNGKLEFYAPPSTTRQIANTGYYELEMTTSGGDVYRVISGAISPIEEIVQ